MDTDEGGENVYFSRICVIENVTMDYGGLLILSCTLLFIFK